MIRTGKREHDLTAHTLSWLGRPIAWMAGASAYLIGLIVAATFLASALAAVWIIIDTLFIVITGG